MPVTVAQLVCVDLLIAILMDMRYYLIVFVCISLMISDVEHVFISLSAIFGEMSLKVLHPFLKFFLIFIGVTLSSDVMTGE